MAPIRARRAAAKNGVRIPATMLATAMSENAREHVLRVYGHLLPGVDRDAARRLGELVKRRAQ